MGHIFYTRQAALAFIVEIYGGQPNRTAALRRAKRQEGFRAVRVVLRQFGAKGVRDG